MPELPEVQTIVTDLNKVLPGLKITGVWSGHKKAIKYPKKFEDFEKEVVGEKILGVERRGKNILINLSHNKLLLIHQKMTGHLMFGKWSSENRKNNISGVNNLWKSDLDGPLKNDPKNGFIRFILYLSGGKQLALSDVRKFAKIMAGGKDFVVKLAEIGKLGVEPLEKSFTFKKFIEIFSKKKGKIKTLLMDQSLVAGIGNIYSDEILWDAGIHPLRNVQKITEEEFKELYIATKIILKKSIKLRGDSNVDYRDAFGKMGKYQNYHKAYQMTGTECQKKDGGIIEKTKIGGRSAHFCPTHQK